MPIAHSLAVTCYLGATALAAAPLARPVPAPVRWVVRLLALGVGCHVLALAAATRELGQIPLTGFGPALSVAALLLAVSVLAAEMLAREVTLTLVAAPVAALCVVIATASGLTPAGDPQGAGGAWLLSHIALSFVGIAAYATAAAAGAVYLLEHRELKSRRFGAVFRLFPPLQTLDRVNHLAAIGGWLGLTIGVTLAATYSVAYRQLDVPKIVWSLSAWLALTVIAFGRVRGGLQARRAALLSAASFVVVVALYLAARVVAAHPGRFL